MVEWVLCTHAIMFTPFLLLVLVSSIENAISNPSALKIAGGEPVNIQDYPYQVYIDCDGYACGGTILSEIFILTAAHCTVGTGPSKITVRAGSNRRNSGGVVIRVEHVSEHPNFNSETFDNDVAVIKLKTPLNFGDSVNLISLPPADYPIESNRLATVTGYGYISDHGPMAPSLQKVELPLISTEDCQGIYGADQITERMFCAGYAEGGKDACQGDSGGPIVLDGKVIGVVSFGPDCATAGQPGAYAKVSALRSFIDSVIS